VGPSDTATVFGQVLASVLPNAYRIAIKDTY
jgi:hypothetical protein